MKTFSMSQYPNMETLLEARSMYYESLACTLAEELTGFTMELLDRLVDLEEVELDEASGKYYWTATGDKIYE